MFAARVHGSPSPNRVTRTTLYIEHQDNGKHVGPLSNETAFRTNPTIPARPHVHVPSHRALTSNCCPRFDVDAPASASSRSESRQQLTRFRTGCPSCYMPQPVTAHHDRARTIKLVIHGTSRRQLRSNCAPYLSDGTQLRTIFVRRHYSRDREQSSSCILYIRYMAWTLVILIYTNTRLENTAITNPNLCEGCV